MNALNVCQINKNTTLFKYTNNLFKINKDFRSFLHPQVKIIKEKSTLKLYTILKSIKHVLL